MTLSKLLRLYGFYKRNYDFQLAKVSYAEAEEAAEHEGEFLPD